MASSSSFPFTFRVDPPPPSSSSHRNDPRSHEPGRPLALSREERRRLREERERDERELPAEREDEIGGWYEQRKRGWGGMLLAEEKETDSGEPPVKRRRGIATTLVDGVVSAALVGTAVGLTAFRMWRDRGKQLPPDDLPQRPPPHLLAQPLESHVFAADHETIDHSLEGEERIDRPFSALRSPPPSYHRQEEFVTAPSTPSAIYPPSTTTSLFDLLPSTQPNPRLSNSNPPFTRRPPLLPSRSSFLPPAELDSHIDNLNSKLSRMMQEARLALLSPIARFAEEDPVADDDDAVTVEEEVSDGRCRNLDQSSSSSSSGGRMRESWSMPSFPRPSDQVFAAGGGTSLPRSTSTSSHRLASPGHRSRPSFSHSHHRQRSLTSNSTSTSTLSPSPSSSTLSTPFRYRRDLLLPTSTSTSRGDAHVLFVSQEEEEEEREGSFGDQEGKEEQRGQGSLASMLESTSRSFGIDLGGTGGVKGDDGMRGREREDWD